MVLHKTRSNAPSRSFLSRSISEPPPSGSLQNGVKFGSLGKINEVRVEGVLLKKTCQRCGKQPKIRRWKAFYCLVSVFSELSWCYVCTGIWSRDPPLGAILEYLLLCHAKFIFLSFTRGKPIILARVVGNLCAQLARFSSGRGGFTHVTASMSTWCLYFLG